ncbi:MAG: hypothetical protein ABSC64_11765 [Candidatus Korobacteraceae bacterium]
MSSPRKSISPDKRIVKSLSVALALGGLLVAIVLCPAAAAQSSSCSNGVCKCTTGALPNGNGEDLEIYTGTCTAHGGIYSFHNVNIYGGGTLSFADDGPIDFWAESILIENRGSLVAGLASSAGAYKSRLTFHLWGKSMNVGAESTHDGIVCKSPPQPQGAPCGIPDELWTANPGMAQQLMMDEPMPPTTKNAKCASKEGYSEYLPGNDCFYQYEVQDASDRTKMLPAYFGHKVLAVSFGGTLQLHGAKGSTFSDPLNCKPSAVGNECNPSTTGKSWVRLTGVSNGKKTLTLNGPVDWKKDDHIVVTTTDYLPEHSEEMILDADATSTNTSATVTLTKPLQNEHYWDVKGLPAVDLKNGPTADIGPTDDPNRPDVKHAVDTRAAVGLLSRNIQIVSEGDTAQPGSTADNFPPTPGNFYGGHTIVRQGFLSYQVQGVEFYRLGQGGAKGRYPVHFHMARKTPQPPPPKTITDPPPPPLDYLKDCSIHDSMTRWVTLHATEGMYIARNVGYLSIGHGYYLEDATEVNNKLYANLGVMARAAIVSPTLNPRQVPGILADTVTGPPPPDTNPFPVNDKMPYRSDFQHPTVFWIMNGWNDFQYNMAAGAATCGACYWWLPSAVSGPSQYQHFDGYASQQIFIQNNSLNNTGSAGLTPLQNFVGNSCVAAMTSFQTVGTTSDCLGVLSSGGTGNELVAVPSSAPSPPEYVNVNAFDLYYPGVSQLHNPTTCNNFDKPGTDCSKDSSGNPAPQCSNENPVNCAATVLDRYTTSFNWAQTNFSAVWLRPKWFLVSNSAITDVQTGGLNFVTGGGYSRSDVPVGYWSVVRKSAFVGQSQSQDPTAKHPEPNFYASDAGPFNPKAIKQCDNGSDPDHCMSFSQGVTFLLPPFPGQRLFNIYDGPAFQEYNFYTDVHQTITDCTPGSGSCLSEYALTRNIGVPLDKTKQQCYLPNAAIAWKQPNGFYYPPAFNSNKLWFKDVDIRHFVVEPFFKTDPSDPYNPFFQDQGQIMERYCTYNNNTFGGFNHIDRQTLLNDDDGSLTGLLANDTQLKATGRETISINQDPYFNSPLITPECLSEVDVAPLNPNNKVFTASTSPYEWLTTAMIADCALPVGSGAPSLFQCLDSQQRIQWARACTDPSCRGVALYREYLTDEEYKVNPRPQPEIRMMGQATAQRSTLTLNQGAYYIDTTQTCAEQGGAQGLCPVCKPNTDGSPGCSSDPGSANPTIFLPGRTYYVFFLYAKPTTHQTYDIYVGKDEDLKVTPVLAYVPGLFTFFPFPSGKWVNADPYNAATGTVRVTLDLKNEQEAFDNSLENFCQPSSFCTSQMVNGKRVCGCNPNSKNPKCTDPAVCAWATKQLDCPLNVDGKDPFRMECYGFSFTMPDDFTIPKPNNTPDPSLFVPYTKNPYFTKGTVVTFTNKQSNGSDVMAGDCNYTSLPTQP